MRKLKLKELNRHSVESYAIAEKTDLIVILDDIRSALNVGSVFRTADAMGIKKVILCGITAQPPSREITKTAIGATESVNWQYFESITEALISLKKDGYNLLSIEQTTESIEMMDYSLDSSKIAIILGNEVHGVSDEALALTDQAIEIAQYGTKHSLNVSVCGGIVIHHFSELLRKLTLHTTN